MEALRTVPIKEQGRASASAAPLLTSALPPRPLLSQSVKALLLSFHPLRMKGIIVYDNVTCSPIQDKLSYLGFDVLLSTTGPALHELLPQLTNRTAMLVKMLHFQQCYH